MENVKIYAYGILVVINIIIIVYLKWFSNYFINLINVMLELDYKQKATQFLFILWLIFLILADFGSILIMSSW
jgi:hypothetical protein